MSQICTDAAAWEEPSTEYTDITEPTAENILPQIPLSTDANFRGCTCLKCTNRVNGALLAGGAVVSTAPTKLTTHSVRLVSSVGALETSAPLRSAP